MFKSYDEREQRQQRQLPSDFSCDNPHQEDVDKNTLAEVYDPDPQLAAFAKRLSTVSQKASTPKVPKTRVLPPALDDILDPKAMQRIGHVLGWS